MCSATSELQETASAISRETLTTTSLRSASRRLFRRKLCRCRRKRSCALAWAKRACWRRGDSYRGRRSVLVHQQRASRDHTPCQGYQHFFTQYQGYLVLSTCFSPTSRVALKVRVLFSVANGLTYPIISCCHTCMESVLFTPATGYKYIMCHRVQMLGACVLTAFHTEPL
jgi:hypothetical protein